jgi:hypothetical protein
LTKEQKFAVNPRSNKIKHVIYKLSVTTLAISWQAKLNVRYKYCFTETYAHFGSGMPQSAQNLFAGWFNRHSNNSLELAGSGSENHHK